MTRPSSRHVPAEIDPDRTRQTCSTPLVTPAES